MKTSELSGYLLDYYVGKALGKNVKIIKHQREDEYFCAEEIPTDGAISTVKSILKAWNPSENWAIAGPLIEKVGVDIQGLTGYRWMASGPTVSDYVASRPLIAAMRCIVDSAFGSKVPNEGEKE